MGSKSKESDDSEKDQTYFGYYGMLIHQQNMLLDAVRTSTYQTAILSNYPDFQDKVVLDIGAGTGILSFFAAKAGARRVYAVEASEMAEHARRLVAANGLTGVIQVLKGKIEEIDLPEPVDVIISEPMGVLLVHERMMESFLCGRDRFLVPGIIKPSQMFPSSGTISIAPFTDTALYADAYSKVSFWNNSDFYGVNLETLMEAAAVGQFSQVIVGPFDPRTLLAVATTHEINFCTDSVADLQKFRIEFRFRAEATGIVHGIAGWFDVLFAGSLVARQLSTGPFSDTTHWYQSRFLLSQPIAVNRGQVLTGYLNFKANAQRSMDVQVLIELEGTDIQLSQSFALQDQQYWNLSGSTSNNGKEFLGLYSDFLSG